MYSSPYASGELSWPFFCLGLFGSYFFRGTRKGLWLKVIFLSTDFKLWCKKDFDLHLAFLLFRLCLCLYLSLSLSFFSLSQSLSPTFSSFLKFLFYVSCSYLFSTSLSSHVFIFAFFIHSLILYLLFTFAFNYFDLLLHLYKFSSFSLCLPLSLYSYFFNVCFSFPFSIFLLIFLSSQPFNWKKAKGLFWRSQLLLQKLEEKSTTWRSRLSSAQLFQLQGNHGQWKCRLSVDFIGIFTMEPGHTSS